jgi:hypothetical protein
MKSILTLAFGVITLATVAQNTSYNGSGSGGTNNTTYGFVAGNAITGDRNMFIGYASGRSGVSGAENTYLGAESGFTSTSGSANTFLGRAAGYQNTSGSRNTYLGVFAGANGATGSGNVFIGYYAGFNEGGSDKLYIDNSQTSTPLISGDFNTNQVGINVLPGAYTLNVGGTLNTTGAVTIGASGTSTGYKLAVGGKAIAEEVVVKLQANWPDYVFEKDYKLPSFSELELFIKQNKHLPGMPTAVEVKDQGIAVGEMNALLLKKVEELTLYILEQQKMIAAQEQRIHKLEISSGH